MSIRISHSRMDTRDLTGHEHVTKLFKNGTTQIENIPRCKNQTEMHHWPWRLWKDLPLPMPHETIWKTCFEEMNFETWDPDVTEVCSCTSLRLKYFASCVVWLLTLASICLTLLLQLIDVSGGCHDGTTFTFVMKAGGMQIPQTLSGVKKNESITFYGTYCGSKILGTITLSPDYSDETNTKTKVNYIFYMEWCVGSILKTLNPKAIIEGTEMGLANMVRLSEDAQQKQ